MLDPKNIIHDLAILYISKQDTENLTPSDFYDEYLKAANEIKEYSFNDFNS